jgi:hypothetical protein
MMLGQEKEGNEQECSKQQETKRGTVEERDIGGEEGEEGVEEGQGGRAHT